MGEEKIGQVVSREIFFAEGADLGLGRTRDKGAAI
jgi:hypothetical protein